MLKEKNISAGIILTGVIFFSFIMNVSLMAQNSLSWEECVEYALGHNLQIKHTALLVENQKLNVRGAKNAYLPGISGGSGYYNNYGRSIDPKTNDIINEDFFTNSYYIQGSIALFQGFRRTNRVKIEKYIYEYSKENLNAQQIIVSFGVMEAYFDALFYSGMKDISQEQLAISKTELQKAVKMVSLGRASGSEVTEIEAQLATDSLTAIQFDLQWINAIHSLKKEMNYPLYDTLVLKDFKIENNQITESPAGIETIVNSAQSWLPEIKMLEANLEAARKQLGEIKGNAYPQLYFNSSWSSGFYETRTDSNGSILPFNEQMNTNAQTSIGLSLSIPLFNRLNNYNNIQKARVNLELAKNEYESQFVELEYEIYAHLLELKAAQKEYLASLKNVDKQELAFKLAEKKREKGLINIIDYYDVKNQFASSKAELLRTSLQLFLKHKTIQYYLTGEIL